MGLERGWYISHVASAVRLEGKECPFLACGIRVCSFSHTSDILICVIGEKIYAVFRDGISECLAQSMELNCQAIVGF